eukprot:963932-Pyramimonas_sp.AAC.1
MGHPRRSRAIAHAGPLLSRCQKSSRDGRAAFELRRGRPFKRATPKFGAPMLHLKVAGKRGGA